MDDLVVRQKTAMQIASSGNKIATAEQLADLRSATNEDGRRTYPRYKDGGQEQRLSWLSRQLFGLALIAHINVDPMMAQVDIVTLDGEIMDNDYMKDMTLVEIQEAFRRGINREYGDYFGLSSISLSSFLRGFLRSDKKRSAAAIIRRRNAKKTAEAEISFQEQLKDAQMKGLINMPDFSGMVSRKKVYSAEESAAHRELVRRQAQAVREQAKREAGNEK